MHSPFEFFILLDRPPEKIVENDDHGEYDDFPQVYKYMYMK